MLLGSDRAFQDQRDSELSSVADAQGQDRKTYPWEIDLTAESEHVISSGNVWESLALTCSGLLVAAVGALWWLFDADPQHGRVVIIGGLAVAGVGLLVRHHDIGNLGRIGIALAVVLLAVIAGFELRDAIQEIKEDRVMHLLIEK